MYSINHTILGLVHSVCHGGEEGNLYFTFVSVSPWVNMLSTAHFYWLEGEYLAYI
jgi:hypothetical protein